MLFLEGNFPILTKTEAGEIKRNNRPIIQQFYLWESILDKFLNMQKTSMYRIICNGEKWTQPKYFSIGKLFCSCYLLLHTQQTNPSSLDLNPSGILQADLPKPLRLGSSCTSACANLPEIHWAQCPFQGQPPQLLSNQFLCHTPEGSDPVSTATGSFSTWFSNGMGL